MSYTLKNKARGYFLGFHSIDWKLPSGLKKRWQKQRQEDAIV